MPDSRALKNIVRDSKKAFKDVKSALASRRDLKKQMKAAKTPSEKADVLLKRMQRKSK